MCKTIYIAIGILVVGFLIVIGVSNISGQVSRNNQLKAEIAKDYVDHAFEHADLAPTPSSRMFKLSDDGRRNVIWCSDDGEGRIGWRIERPAVAATWAPELKVVTSEHTDHDGLMAICEKAFRG